MLVAEFDDGLEIEPVDARRDVNAQSRCSAIDAACLKILFAVNLKTCLRELWDGVHQEVEGMGVGTQFECAKRKAVIRTLETVDRIGEQLIEVLLELALTVNADQVP